MEDEISFRDLFLERPGKVLPFLIGMAFILIVLGNWLLVDYAIKRINVSDAARQLVDSYLSGKIVADIFFYLIIYGFLTGLIIRATVRLVEPENVMTMSTALAIAFLSVILMYFIKGIFSVALILASGGVTIDLAGVSDADGFMNALEDGFDAWSDMHPKISYLVILLSYLGLAIYLFFVRFLTYRKHGPKAATATVSLILAFLLLSAL